MFELKEDYAGLELSTRLLIEEARLWGIQVEILDRRDQFIRLIQGSRVEYVKQATRTSADAYIAPLIMENKSVTKLVLREHGIQVPDGVEVHTLEEAELAYPEFSGLPIVVKPKSTNFGQGVVILGAKHPATDFAEAVKLALDYDEGILIEHFISGPEYRFLVIGGETVAVLSRIPANITGDGVHTIEQLVALKNTDPLRGEGYVTPLEKLKLGRVERDFLKTQSMSVETVPDEGERVFLRENSNISTGGDSIDCTDLLGDEYKQIAVLAAEAVGAKICGVDMIVQTYDAPPNATNHSIIELNFNPALHIHNYPYDGVNRHVERKVLELLGFKLHSLEPFTR